MSNSGIYLIVNTVNNKIYVGSAVEFQDRWRLHKLELNRNNHHNRHLQAAWSLYGTECFQFHAIEYTLDLIKREQYWTERLNATDINVGYNICKIANNRTGVKASDETRQKLSDAHKGKKQSEETKAKRNLFAKGNTVNNGRKQSADQIENRVKQFRGIKHQKPRNRNIIEWSCSDGRACKCDVCMEKKREYKRKWRFAQMGVDFVK